MSDVKRFFDTNVLLYLLSEDLAKADRAEELVAKGGVISIQVLNEFATVASRKLGISWREIKEILVPIRAVCEIEAMTLETHDRGIDVADRYRFSFYDATLVASALGAGCQRLYTEDLQHEQVIEGRLTILNPFTSI